MATEGGLPDPEDTVEQPRPSFLAIWRVNIPPSRKKQLNSGKNFFNAGGIN